MNTVKQPSRVLLVEDDEGSLELFSIVLSKMGYIVYRAVTGSEALDVVSNFSPNAIVISFGFSDYATIELSRQFRKIPTVANAIIIGVSRYGRSKRADDISFFFDRYLEQPVGLAAMLGTLDCLEDYKGNVLPFVRVSLSGCYSS